MKIFRLLNIYIFFWMWHVQALTWDEGVSQETIADSLGTWNTFFKAIKGPFSKEDFLLAIQKGEYQELSIDDFLRLNVENHRLAKYRHANIAEEIYPPGDRPRGAKDLESVKYFMHTHALVSPIIVARVHVDGKMRYIKLDGVHRLAAAALQKLTIKVLFVDL